MPLSSRPRGARPDDGAMVEGCGGHPAHLSPTALGLIVGKKRASDCSACFQSARRSIVRDSHVAASRLCKFALWLPY